MSLLILYYWLSRFTFVKRNARRMRFWFEETVILIAFLTQKKGLLMWLEETFILIPFLMQSKWLLDREFKNEQELHAALDRSFNLQCLFLRIYPGSMITLELIPLDDDSMASEHINADQFFIAVHRAGAFTKENFRASIKGYIHVRLRHRKKSKRESVEASAAE